MDQNRREVLVHLLAWWLKIVQEIRKTFLSMVVIIAMRRRRICHEHGVEASSASRKRKRCTVDCDDRFIELLREVARQMNETITAVTDRLCNCVGRSARDAEMDAMVEQLYSELLKVEGLTEDEVYHAHIKLSTSDRLMVSFKSVPNAHKAAWLRHVIG